MERITNKTAHVMSVLTNKLGIDSLDQAPPSPSNDFAENQANSNAQNPFNYFAHEKQEAPPQYLPNVSTVEVTNPHNDPLSQLILENLIALDPTPPTKLALEAELAQQLIEKEQEEIKNQLADKLNEQLAQEDKKRLEEDIKRAKAMSKLENSPEDQKKYGTNIIFSHEESEYICKNIVEEVVVSRTIEIMPKLSNCTCTKCTNDVIAMALNQLQPKYVVTSKGQLIAKLHAYETQHYTNITSAITKACVLINNKPRHY